MWAGDRSLQTLNCSCGVFQADRDATERFVDKDALSSLDDLAIARWQCLLSLFYSMACFIALVTLHLVIMCQVYTIKCSD